MHKRGSIALVSAALVAVLLAAMLWRCHAQTRGGSDSASVMYAREVADAKRAGVPTTAQDLQQPLPRPNTNAAIVIGQLTQRLKSHPVSKQDLIAEDTNISTMPSALQIAQVRAAVAHRADLLALTHRAADRPNCVFKRASNPSNFDGLQWSAVREAERWLAVESLLMAHDGKPMQAVNNEALGFNLARDASSMGSVLYHLLGMVYSAITIRTMSNILYLSGGQPSVARLICNVITKDWRPVRLFDVFKAELGKDVVTIAYYRRREPEFLSELRQDSFSEPGKDPSVYIQQVGWDRFLDENGVLILRTMRRPMAVADLPYQSAMPAMRSVEADLVNPNTGSTVLAHWVCQDHPDILTLTARQQARISMLRAAALLLVWKSDHGRFPDSLPQAISPVAADPFDGEPLKYRREGNGFVVYSVGKNGSYTGGSPQRPPDPFEEEDEFRWPMPPYLRGPIKEPAPLVPSAPGGHSSK